MIGPEQLNQAAVIAGDVLNGNLEQADAISLLQNIARHLSRGDQILLGVDLVKKQRCHACGL